MIVIKVGGSEGIDYDAFCDDIAHLKNQGEDLIIVHGGSHLTNEVATKLGHPPQFVTSPSGFTSRLTDRRTLEIFEMVYCGQMNKGIVEKLQQRGINAVGLSGIDGRLWEGTRKKAIRAVGEDGRKRIIRDNYTGKVQTVNVALLKMLLSSGFTPVLTPPAISIEGEAINVDGDRAAAITAQALNAATLVILSNVPGVLRDFPNETSLISAVSYQEIDEVIETVAAGRMKIKLLGAKEAIQGGVGRVILADARILNGVINALDGGGTHIT